MAKIRREAKTGETVDPYDYEHFPQYSGQNRNGAKRRSKQNRTEQNVFEDIS